MNINKLLNDASSKINKFVEEQKNINEIVDNSKTFELDKEINTDKENITMYRPYEYLEMCPYFNLNYAKIVDLLVPLFETVLKIVDIVQKKDRQEYLMILTEKRIIIMDRDKYLEYNYDDIKHFSLIKKGLMSQLINLNDIILDMNVNYEEAKEVYHIMSNSEFRNSVLKKMTTYLCGITPVYQILNKYGSGISMDKDNMIVFHDKKKNNYLCKYDDIINYEIVEDSTVVLEKYRKEQSTALKNNKSECYKIIIRITFKDNKTFEMEILPPTTFNTAYKHVDSVYKDSYNFAKEIIDKLETFNEDMYFKK